MSVPKSDMNFYASRIGVMALDFIDEVSKRKEDQVFIEKKFDELKKDVKTLSSEFLKKLEVQTYTGHNGFVELPKLMKFIKDYTQAEISEGLFRRGHWNQPEVSESYFDLVRNVIERSISNYRPDIFLMMNPQQRTLNCYIKNH